jgi:molybdate transport system substrate-binding protein
MRTKEQTGRARLHVIVRTLMHVGVLGIVLGASLVSARAEQIVVLAAASTAAAMDEAIARFDAGPGNRVVGAYAGTSTLARQIESGAPAHVFLSANRAWMDYLEARGFIAPESRRTLVHNQLVFIARDDSPLRFLVSPSLDLSTILDGERLAMGDPNHVPVGIYGRQALEKLGLWSGVSRQVAPTADVRAALALVVRGEAPLGIAYATDLGRAPELRMVAPIPTTLHEPIVYPIARVDGSNSVLADRFLAFLVGPEGQAAFGAMGFAVD